MADGVVQWIRLLLDKGSVAQTTAEANTAGQQIGAAAAQGVTSKGEQAGRDMIAKLVKELQDGAARVKEQVASGLKTEDEGRAAGERLGRSFVAELTKSLSGMKAMGLITEEEFKRLQGSAVPALQAIRSEFQKVDVAEKSTGEHTSYLQQSFERMAIRLAEIFAIHEIINFGKEAVGAFDDLQKELNRTAATLANFGTDFADVRSEVNEHADAVGKLGIKNVEYYRTFNMILGITGDYEKALRGTDAAMNLAITSGRTSEETATAIGKAYQGSNTSLMRYGVTLDKHKDVADQINALTGEQAQNRAAGFAGSVGRIAVAWEEFQQKLGQAITQMGGGTSVIDVLVAGIKGLTEWVKENADVVRQLGMVVLGVFQTVGGAVTLLAHAFTGLRILIAGVAYTVDTTSAAFQSFGSAALFVVGKVLEGIGFLSPAADRAGKSLLDISKRLHDGAVKDMAENRKALAQTISDIQNGTDKIGDVPVTLPTLQHNKPPNGKPPTGNPDTALTREIELLGKGLTLDDQRVASAAKLDAIEASLNTKLQQRGLTLDQEIKLQDHLKEIEKARETPDTVLAQEITTLRDRLTINQQDAAARTRLVAIQAELTKRQQDTTKSALEQYNVNKLLVEVNGALAKDALGPLQAQATLLHEMAQYPELRNKALTDGAALLAKIDLMLAASNLKVADEVALLRIRNALNKDQSDDKRVKDLEREATALIQLTKNGKTAEDAYRRLTVLLKQLTDAAATAADPADQARILAARNKVEAILNAHPLQAKNFFKDLRETFETNLPNIAESAAANMVDSFDAGFQRLISGAGDVRSALGGIATGMAAGFKKELADLAKSKAKENLAHSVEEAAKAIADGADMNWAGAAMHAEASAHFLAVAAEWAVLGGAAGGGGGSGRGGASGGTQPGNIGGKSAANMTPTGPQIVLHIDGIDPKNPRHQELAGLTLAQYAQRAGATFVLGGKS